MAWIALQSNCNSGCKCQPTKMNSVHGALLQYHEPTVHVVQWIINYFICKIYRVNLNISLRPSDLLCCRCLMVCLCNEYIGCGWVLRRSNDNWRFKCPWPCIMLYDSCTYQIKWKHLNAMAWQLFEVKNQNRKSKQRLAKNLLCTLNVTAGEKAFVASGHLHIE